MLEEVQPDHGTRSAISITKLPLGHDILDNKKEKCDFYFSTFWLSNSNYSFITGSVTQQVNFIQCKSSI